MMNRLSSILLSLLISNVILAQVDYLPFSNWEWGNQNGSQHYVYTPSGMEPGKKYPLVLTLHGCCGPDNNARPDNLIEPIVRVWHGFGENVQKEPTYIVVGATSSGWSQHETNYKAVINGLITGGQVDPQRIYIIGFSMGGGGTFDYISNDPDYFAAAMPMALNGRGSQSTQKDIPMWASRGEVDGVSPNLGIHIDAIRNLNGDTRELLEWTTGINPNWTEHDALGHGIMLQTATIPGFYDWALEQVNDGNIYPNVRFVFSEYIHEYPSSETTISVTAVADDADGSIDRVDFYVNGLLRGTDTGSPYTASVPLEVGDNKIEARAYDNEGKYRTATFIAQRDGTPQIITNTLPDAKVGEYYEYKVQTVGGNAPYLYILSGIPNGMNFDLSTGILSGFASEFGLFNMTLIVRDKEQDQATRTISLNVRAATSNSVAVTDITTSSGSSELTALLTNNGVHIDEYPEINFGGQNDYFGAQVIRMTSDGTTSNSTDPNYLTFTLDAPATVYVGYEDYTNISSSTPSWLNSFTPTGETIVAQYRYYALYSRDYTAGQVTLGGAAASGNGVATNYFVMILPQGYTGYEEVEITTFQLPSISAETPFEIGLSALGGDQNFTWELASGELPQGVTLSNDGTISGASGIAGQYSFEVTAIDKHGNSDTETVSLLIDGPDNIAPTVPNNLQVSHVTSNSLTLSWGPSTDNFTLYGYDVYRDGNLIGTVPGTSMDINGLSAETSYTFTVRARDTNGNASVQSSGYDVTTTEPGVTDPVSTTDPTTTSSATPTDPTITSVDKGKKRIEIFPNPGKDKFMVLAEVDINSICLTNVLGNKVVCKDHTNEIVVGRLPQGIYFVNIEDVNGNTTVKRWIVE